jgi:hypothetical protein
MCEHSFVPTITISYSFTGLSNGAWLVSNTHSSWLINISSLKKRATLRWSSRCVQEFEHENKDMDEAWRRKDMNVVNYLRGAVFRLQIHATNTWGTRSRQIKQELTLLGKITWAWAMGQDCRLRNDCIKCCPCQSTTPTHLTCTPLSWVKTRTQRQLKESAKRKKREQSLSRTLYPPRTREWVFHSQIVNQ